MKSKLMHSGNPLGENSRGGRLWTACLREPLSVSLCASPTQPVAKVQQIHCMYGVQKCHASQMHQTHFLCRVGKICLHIMSPRCLKWIRSIMYIYKKSLYMQSRPNLNMHSCHFSGCFSYPEASRGSYCYGTHQAAGQTLCRQMVIVSKLFCK